MFNFFKKKSKFFVEGSLEDNRSSYEKEKDYLVEELLTSSPLLIWQDFNGWKEKPEIKRMLQDIEVHEQGSTGSCAAQSGALALAIHNWIEEGRFIKFSAKPIYSRRVNKPQRGMYMHDLGNICIKYGTVFEKIYPSPNTAEEEMNNLDNWLPSYDGIAKIYKANNYFWLPINIDWFATILDKNKPIVLSVKFGLKDKWNSFVPEVIDQKLIIGHTIVSLPNAYFNYQGKKAILIQDSHGANIGWQGRKILTEDWFIKKRVFLAIYFEDNKNLFICNSKIEKPKLKLSKNLKVGDRGSDVGKLQIGLGLEKDEKGFLFPLSSITPTNYFGGITRSGVQRFQRKYGLKITGEVNDETRKTFNSIFS